MADEARTAFTRRAFARLTLWGAVGLSVVPGCRRKGSLPGAGGGPDTIACYAPLPPDTGGPDAVARWAELGDVWREMSRHMRRRDEGPTAEEFEQLRSRMEDALEAVSASSELTTAFEERWQHVHDTWYADFECYANAGWIPTARGSVEKQVAELEKLVAEGTLTVEAGEKAAEAMGTEVEFLTRYGEARAEETLDANDVLTTYRRGELPVGQDAVSASETLVELTVDDPGWLSDIEETPDE